MDHRIVAVETGNMLGKGFLIGGLVPWFLWTRKHSLVYICGAGQTQIGSVHFKEIRWAVQNCPFWKAGLLPMTIGASLLTAVGLPELIARDKVNYERIAIGLARNPEDLRQLRGRLAATMKNSPLFDTPRFVHNLESAYQEMWDNHAAGHSPRPIKVIDDFDQSKAHPPETGPRIRSSADLIRE